MKPKPPTIKELVSIIEAYNVARANELRTLPPNVAGDYKNPLMEALYDAAQLAAEQLKPALTVSLNISPPQ